MKCLLYIGSGWDAYPLTLEFIRKNHDMILYIDALPTTPHFTEGQYGYPKALSIDTICDALIEEGGYQAIEGEPIKSTSHVSFSLKNDCILKYYFNTKDVDINKSEEIVKLLPCVETMWVTGYSPKSSVYDWLPNLDTIYSTAICSYNIPERLDNITHIVRDRIEFLDGNFRFFTDYYPDTDDSEYSTESESEDDSVNEEKEDS